MYSTSRILLWGLVLCAGQSLLEAVLGWGITRVRQASIVNLEGALLYAIVRFVLTVGPYVAGFYFAFKVAPSVRPVRIAFVLNLLIIGFMLYAGGLALDPYSFSVASIVVSVLLVIILEWWGRLVGSSNNDGI